MGTTISDVGATYEFLSDYNAMSRAPWREIVRHFFGESLLPVTLAPFFYRPLVRGGKTDIFRPINFTDGRKIFSIMAIEIKFLIPTIYLCSWFNDLLIPKRPTLRFKGKKGKLRNEQSE